jgi:hypothetical protein
MEFYIANLQKAVDREAKLKQIERERQVLSGDFMEELRTRIHNLPLHPDSQKF